MKLTSVGIKNIRFPVKIREESGNLQETVATVGLLVNMPNSKRDSCLPAFLSIMNNYQDDISATVFPALLQDILQQLKAKSAKLEMFFPYFLEKQAPVTKTPGLMEYTCSFTGEMSIESQPDDDFTMAIWVPMTTLCPCSKEISDYGAHNQRAEISLSVKYNEFIWLEEIIKMVEQSASCEVFSLLKRPDEKFVTEKAYDNPMFVEDAVRKVAEAAEQHPKIDWFSVGVESFESIHKHSAYAFVLSDTMR